VNTAAAGAVVAEGNVVTLAGMDDAGTEYGGMEDGRMEDGGIEDGGMEDGATIRVDFEETCPTTTGVTVGLTEFTAFTVFKTLSGAGGVGMTVTTIVAGPGDPPTAVVP